MPKKRFIRLFQVALTGLLMFFSIHQVATVWAAFIGPSRTVTETVQEGHGWGRECQLVSGSYQWVTTTTCNGCSASCVNKLETQYPDPNPASICNASYLGSKVHDYSCTEVEREITYQPAAIGAAVFCAQPGSRGWCRSDVVVNLTGSEGVDACGKYTLTLFEDNLANTAPASGCSAAAAFTITANGTTQYQAWVHSSLGDTSEMVSQTILVDKSPPSLSYSQPDLFTLELSGTDGHSGVDHFEANINGGGWVQGAVHTLLPGVNNIHMRAFDIAGNATTDSVMIIIDNTPPETLLDAISPAAPDGQAGWYITAPTITVTAADSQTGIVFAGAVLDGVEHGAASGYRVGDGVHFVQIKAVDGAGNPRVQAPSSFQNPLKVDTGMPVLAVGISPAPVVGDWYDAAVVVNTLGSYDTGSGLGAVSINLDGAGFQSGATMTLDEEGMHTVVVQASDLAGNTVSKAHEINVDLNPPYVNPIASGQKGPGLADLVWFRSPVSVEANAGDSAGGPVKVEYSLNGAAYLDGGLVSVDEPGVHDLTFRVTDPVDRTADEGIAFGIDPDAPEISITSHEQGDMVKGSLHLSGTAFDNLSGIFRVELKVGQGAWNEYSPLALEASVGEVGWEFDLSLKGMDGGPLVLYVRAQDNAGSYSAEKMISLLVNNRSARLEVPESWLVGQTIIPEHVRGDTGGVVKAVAVVSHPKYGSQSIALRPSNDWAIRWKGVFEYQRIWAPPGEYTVIVTSWDQYGNAASDRGVIVVPLPEDGPTQILERFEVYGVVTALSLESVTIDGASYQITPDSALAEGVFEEVLVYGEAERSKLQAAVVWLKPVREVPIQGIVDLVSAESLQVSGQQFELTTESQLPAGLAPDALVSGVGLEDGRGDPDVLWLELIATEPLPFSGIVSVYEKGDVLGVDDAVYTLNEETQISSQSGLEVGDTVHGWYLEDGFLALSVVEVEPEAIAFEGTVVERTGAALLVDASVYNLVEESILPEEISAGHLVAGSAYLYEDGHLELIEAAIIPGEIAGVVTGISESGKGGGYTVYIHNAPYLVSGELPRLREGQEITGWINEDGEIARLRVVTKIPPGRYILVGLVLAFLVWWLFGRTFKGTVVAIEEERRRFTLRLNDDLERPQLRTIEYHKRLAGCVRIHRGKLVRGRIVLFRAWTMKPKDTEKRPQN